MFKGGKLTLIKSTLASPTLLSALCFNFKAPSDNFKTIERHWRNFLWKNHNEDKLTHLLRWSKVSLPIQKGGLNIHKMADINFSFLCKWIWRFHSEIDPLWKKIIIAKYKVLHWGITCCW